MKNIIEKIEIEGRKWDPRVLYFLLNWFRIFQHDCVVRAGSSNELNYDGPPMILKLLLSIGVQPKEFARFLRVRRVAMASYSSACERLPAKFYIDRFLVDGQMAKTAKVDGLFADELAAYLEFKDMRAYLASDTDAERDR